jgi:hypothetical protein
MLNPKEPFMREQDALELFPELADDITLSTSERVDRYWRLQYICGTKRPDKKDLGYWFEVHPGRSILVATGLLLAMAYLFGLLMRVGW